MSVFKTAMVRGICDRLQDLGAIRFPNEKVAHEVCEKVARQLQGPDMLPEGGLGKQSALAIGSLLKSASDRLAGAGYGPDASEILRSKQASNEPWEERAAKVASFCMNKVAEGGSLTSVGPNTAESAAGDDQVAGLDQDNRGTAEYLVGVGNTQFPNGGVVGKQMVHPERQQRSPSISNSLTALDKQASVAELIEKLKGAGGAVSSLAQGAGRDMGQAVRGAASQLGSDAASLRAGDLGLKQFAGSHPVATGAAGLAGLGAVGAGGMGIKALIDRLQSGGGEGEEHLASFALGEKGASEDMAAADLGGQGGGQPQGAPAAGADPGALQKAMMFLQALKHKVPGFGAGPESQVAAGGLSQAPGGMEVMAHVIENTKTASEADDVIQQILQHQGDVGELASPELIQAIQALMEHGGGDPTAVTPEDVKTASSALATIPGFTHSRSVKDRVMGALKSVGRGARSAINSAKDGAGKAVSLAKEHSGTAAKGVGLLGAAGAAGYAGSKLNGKDKEASLLDFLKKASGGSLTDVGPNTAESAAKTDQVAGLDQDNRSTGEYLVGQGKTQFPNKGQQYAIQKNDAHEEPVSTDTTVSREAKSAEEIEYIEQIRKMASVYGPKLPVSMTENEKIAALQDINGLVPSERPAYIAGLHRGR